MEPAQGLVLSLVGPLEKGGIDGERGGIDGEKGRD